MRARLAWSVLAAGLLAAEASAQDLDARQLERIERVVREEGEAILALADLPAGDAALPSDFVLSWHNDYFKAQAGTFVPFVVSITPASRKAAAALLYVRLARRGSENGDHDRPRRRDAGDGGSFPVEEIYPVELAAERGRATRVARGFAVAPGDYDVIVVVRERERRDERRRRLGGVLRRSLSVPDYSGSDLATSSIILADAITELTASLGPGELEERPYVVGSQEIHPAPDSLFRRDEELIVVFLVYNPFVTPDKQFDLEVEYHFFRKSGTAAGSGRPRTGPAIPAALAGETYVNRTEPQRFNPSVLGPPFEPASGQPVMAGQGVPLSGFQEGDYRLAIRVVDLVSGRSLERHVTFTVGS
jgi:hypothetical protein